MTCVRCQHEIPDQALYCQFCGADQQAGSGAGAAPAPGWSRLRRSRAERQLAGVCGGLARYIGTDPVLIRLAWIILTIVPGSIVLGVLAYVVAWLIMPEAEPGSEADPGVTRRLERSATDAKVAGVCGGLAAYFAVDATAVRLLWIVLSIFPGMIVCGLIAYLLAWFVMPAVVAPITPPPPAPATPE